MFWEKGYKKKVWEKGMNENRIVLDQNQDKTFLNSSFFRLLWCYLRQVFFFWFWFCFVCLFVFVFVFFLFFVFFFLCFFFFVLFCFFFFFFLGGGVQLWICMLTGTLSVSYILNVDISHFYFQRCSYALKHTFSRYLHGQSTGKVLFHLLYWLCYFKDSLLRPILPSPRPTS